MTMQTYIEFFKKEELINNNNLMSTTAGEQRLDVCSEDLYKYFSELATDINQSIKTVIAGWRRGYSAAAVGDYLFDDSFNSFAGRAREVSGASELLHEMFSMMGYDCKDNWGVQYGYFASLEERSADPLDVQRDINNRAAAVSKVTGDEAITFGTYQNGTGALRSDKEFDAVSEFRTQVKAALLARRDAFFLETTADDGDDK